jgi:hypothetical protein
MLAVLAGTSARLVDAVCTPDSGTAIYAQAGKRPNRVVLEALGALIDGQRRVEDQR